MKRRKFIKIAGLSIICLGLSQYCKIAEYLIPSNLTGLSTLFDHSFANYASDKSYSILHQELTSKKVIRADTSINFSQVESLAKKDKIIIYQDKYYTKTELELYSLSYLSASQLTE